MKTNKQNISSDESDILLQQQSDSDGIVEEDAVEKLIIRLELILMESGWSRLPENKNILFNNSEPW